MHTQVHVNPQNQIAFAAAPRGRTIAMQKIGSFASHLPSRCMARLLNNEPQQKGVFVCWGRDGSDRRRQYDWTLTWTFICIECVNVYMFIHIYIYPASWNTFVFLEKNPTHHPSLLETDKLPTSHLCVSGNGCIEPGCRHEDVGSWGRPGWL